MSQRHTSPKAITTLGATIVCAGLVTVSPLAELRAQIPVPGSLCSEEPAASTHTPVYPELSPTPRLEPANSFREIARQMLSEADALAARGELTVARRLAQRAQAMRHDWSGEPLTPDDVLRKVGTEDHRHFSNSLDGFQAGNPPSSAISQRFSNVQTPSILQNGTPSPNSISANKRAEVGLWKPAPVGPVTSADLNVPQVRSDQSDVVFPEVDAPGRILADQPEKLSAPSVAPLPPQEVASASNARNQSTSGNSTYQSTQHSNAFRKDTAVRSAESSTSDSPITIAVMHALSALLGLLTGVTVILLLLPELLKRYAANAAPVFRVEVVNGALTTTAAASSRDDESFANGESVAGEQLRKSSRGRVVEMGEAAMPIPLQELSYEEARKQKELESQEQQQTILKHIFEQNVDLRRQIRGEHLRIA